MTGDPRPFEPDWTVHPGAFLDELMDLRGAMTPEQLAEASGIALETVNAILDGTVPIDEQAAGKLGSALSVEPRIWLNFQAGYDADIARGVKSVLTARGDQLPAELRPPVNDSAATAAPGEDEGP